MAEIRNHADFGAFIPSYLDDYPLDVYEFRIYAHISRRAGRGDCWEAIPNLAKYCRINIKTCRKAIAGLIEKGLIEKRSRPGKTTLYILTHPSKWQTEQELEAKQVHAPPTKLGSTKSGRGGKTTSTKSGTTPLPDLVGLPLPNLVDEGIPNEGTPKKERKKSARPDAQGAGSSPKNLGEAPVLGFRISSIPETPSSQSAENSSAGQNPGIPSPPSSAPPPLPLPQQSDPYFGSQSAHSTRTMNRKREATNNPYSAFKSQISAQEAEKSREDFQEWAIARYEKQLLEERKNSPEQCREKSLKFAHCAVKRLVAGDNPDNPDRPTPHDRFLLEKWQESKSAPKPKKARAIAPKQSFAPKQIKLR